MVKSGEAIPVFYDTVFDGESFSEPKQVAGLGLLPFHELYKKVKEEMPKGPLWETYLAVTTLRRTMQRVTALRTAVQKLNDDPTYAADAMKAMGFAPDYEAPPNTNDQVRRAISIDPQIKKFVDDYMEKSRVMTKRYVMPSFDTTAPILTNAPNDPVADATLQRRQQFLFFQKIKHEFIEAGRIFQTARMIGSRKHLMNRSWNEARSLLACWPRMVKFPVDDQRWRAHRAEPVGGACRICGFEDLSDRVPVKARLSLDVPVQKVRPET